MNQYIVQTTHQSKPVYYNTVTKKFLDINTDKEELRKGFFLEGQEQEAITSVLLEHSSQHFTLTVVPTWECTLRCTHCSMNKSLKKHDPDSVDPQALANFIRGYIRQFSPQSLSLSFLGGEPLVKAEQCLEMAKIVQTISFENNIQFYAGISTNLTVDLSDTVLDLFDYCYNIEVSLDGDRQIHNWQRKPVKKSLDPYRKTVHNLRELVSYGFADRILVKCAMRKRFFTKKNCRNFLRTVTRLGIPLDKIIFGNIHPAEQHQELNDDLFAQYLKSPLPRLYPCCKFRAKSQLWLFPNNDLYDVGFPYARHRVGHIADPLDTIFKTRQEMVVKHFSCFQDPGCKNCPVIGYCWGGCVNSWCLTKNQPSQFCDRIGLENLIQRLAKEEKIIEYDCAHKQGARHEQILQALKKCKTSSDNGATATT